MSAWAEQQAVYSTAMAIRIGGCTLVGDYSLLPGTLSNSSSMRSDRLSDITREVTCPSGVIQLIRVELDRISPLKKGWKVSDNGA